MKARAYAKINWYLNILGKLSNGYHQLEMIMQHIDLYDDLDVQLLPDQQLTLKIENAESLAASEDNLIIRAARLLQSETGSPLGASIVLNKRIPMGAGLGGGSADAAAALIALNKLWKLNRSLHELQRIGVRIGADIPYCLESHPAIVCGIGEQVRPLEIQNECWLLLLKPEASLSTKEVFVRYRHQDSERADLERTVSMLKTGEYRSLQSCCINSLQTPAIELLPPIQNLIQILYKNGAHFAQMSGSGSAVYGVFASRDEAKQAFHSVGCPCYRIVTKTLRTAEAL